MLCSIILPVNADCLNPLLKTIESLHRISYRQMEILCLYDEHAGKETPKTLQNAAGYADHLRLIPCCDENQDDLALSTSAMLNLGIRHAEGEFLLFPTPGDIYDAVKLRKMCRRATALKVQILVMQSNSGPKNRKYGPSHASDKNISAVSVLDEEINILRELLPAHTGKVFAGTDIAADAFRLLSFNTDDKLFCTKFIRENGFFFSDSDSSQSGSASMSFTFPAIAAAERILIDDHAAVYRALSSYHSEAMFSVRPNGKYPLLSDCIEQETFRTAIEETLHALQSRGLSARWEQDLLNYCLHVLMWNLKALRGEPFYDLYQMLRRQDDWLISVGIAQQDAGFWYNQEEYCQLQYLLASQNAEEYLFVKMDEAKKHLCALQEQNRTLRQTAGRK